MRIIGATNAVLTRGQWTLGLLGLPVGPIAAGRYVLDGRRPLAEAPDAVTVRLWIVGEGTPAHREVAADTTVLDAPESVAADLAVVRAAALAEAARVQESRSVSAVVDGVAYGIHPEARALWSALLHRIAIAESGGPPMSWPAPFVAYDGTPIALGSASAARALYAALFDAGLARQVAGVAAQIAIASAGSVQEVLAALSAYQEAP